MENNFWLTQFIAFFTFFMIAYVNGLIVKHFDVKVNYTRKVNHFFLFFLPIFLNMVLVYERTLESTLISMVIMLTTFIFYLEPVRNRFSFLQTAFMSFDRPEDRPYTLLWLSTQVAATYVILIPMLIYFSWIGMPELAYIPVIINGIGDGLAEPVGIRFGKHKYKTWALFTQKRYVRSLEGSACVLIMSIVAVYIFKDNFTTMQFAAALVTIPVVMTLAEAFSPHTWDSPVLYTVSGLSISGIMMI